MDQRHTHILLGLIDEYIKTAQPVGSSGLAKALRLDISPATIRMVLHELDQTGYIMQPHTSAGRAPTDKGYRFYVEHLKNKQQSIDSILVKLIAEYQQLAQTTGALPAAAHILSELAESFVMTSSLPDGRIEQSGMSNLINQDEMDTLPAVKEVSWFADHLKNHLEKLVDDDHLTNVYIGRENPVYESDYTSLIVKSIDHPIQGKCVIAIIGPKRMAYQRNISLINKISDLI